MVIAILLIGIIVFQHLKIRELNRELDILEEELMGNFFPPID